MKRTSVIGLGLIVLAGILVGFYLIDKDHASEAEIRFSDATNEIEYGNSSMTSKTLVESVNGTITQYPKLVTTQLGEQMLAYTIEKDGRSTDITTIVTVVDTVKPDIILKKERIALAYGEAYDIEENIISISDPVDGSLQKSTAKELANGTYTIQGTLDVKKSGDQKIRILAKDKSGNTARRSFTVNVGKMTVKTKEALEEKHA